MQDSAKESGISIVRINSERELIEHKLDEAALEITGETAERLFPIYMVFYHEIFRGYFHAIPQTVIYPAIHKEFMKAHEYIHIVKSLVTEMTRMVGNPLFMLCPRASELGPELLAKMALRQTPEIAHMYKPEET